MSIEEKINVLKAIIQECEEYQWQRKETLFEIIKTLEQEPKADALDKIRAEIADYQKEAVYSDDVVMTKRMILGIIDKYKTEMENL
jgi:uncharacterized protein YjgD (DUF1641 family)